MKTLLVVTAWLEAVTGAALIVAPAPPVALLARRGRSTRPAGLVARVAGAALLALGAGLLAGARRWPAAGPGEE